MGFLVIIIIFLATVICLILFQINAIRKQLNMIVNEEKINKQITVSIREIFINEMAVEINQLIKKHNEKEEELEYEKNRLKSQVTSISHDFRTPLTSIKGYLELLQDADDEKRREYLKIIEKKTNSLQKLVEDFYEISLIEDKNYELELTDIFPGYVLEDVAMEYYYEFEKRQIDFSFIKEEDREIFGNENALYRVYRNLFSNMYRHGKEKAEIYHGLRKGKLITVFKNKIADTEEIDESRLFEKFYTADKSRHSTSTGIGMYSSKMILEKMGHKITGSVSNGYMTIIIEYKTMTR